METKTIQIRVGAQVAEKFEVASEEEQWKIKALLSLQLGDITQPKSSLKESIYSMSGYAQCQGLAPEF